MYHSLTISNLVGAGSSLPQYCCCGLYTPNSSTRRCRLPYRHQLFTYKRHPPGGPKPWVNTKKAPLACFVSVCVPCVVLLGSVLVQQQYDVLVTIAYAVVGTTAAAVTAKATAMMLYEDCWMQQCWSSQTSNLLRPYDTRIILYGLSLKAVYLCICSHL